MSDWRKFYVLSILLTITSAIYAQTIDYDAWRNASESNPYDVTSLLVNPTGTGNTGWNRNAADAAAGYNKHNTEFASGVYDNTGIESWYWTPVKGAELIWQDIKGLLPGTYRVKAYAVAQIYNDNSRKGQIGQGAYLFAGSQRVAVTSNKWQELTVTATVDDSQTLRVGICADENNENDWVSIAQVRVECIGYSGFAKIPSLILDERYDVSAAREAGFYDVTLQCTLHTDQYRSFCVPFDMTESDVNKYFSDIKEVSGLTQSSGTYKLRTKATVVVKAGKPYIVKGKTDGRQAIVVNETTVTPRNEIRPLIVSYAGIKFVASYRAHDFLKDIYIISDDASVMEKVSVPVKFYGYGFYGYK